MRINFDFTDLEVFLAVQETGSFQLASEKLSMSQSSVTRRVQKLEDALDTLLFHRTTRAVKPTLAAKRLKVRAEVILNETREAERALRDESSVFAHQLARSITIATVPTVVSNLVAPTLKILQHDHPTTRFRILDLAANEVAEAVSGGEADVGICSVPAYEPHTAFEYLFDDPIVIALPSGHSMAATKETLCWSDLSADPLIVPQRGTGNRMLIDDALARAGLPLVWTFEVGRTTTALDLVSAGLGIAPLPRSAIASETVTRVVIRQIASPFVARPIGLLTPTPHPKDGLAGEFADLIRNAAKLMSRPNGISDEIGKD